MKPGDLVISSRRWGSDLYDDEFAERFITNPNQNSYAYPPSEYSFSPGEIGTVLVVKNVNNPDGKIIKILTPNRVGWVFSYLIEVVNENR